MSSNPEVFWSHGNAKKASSKQTILICFTCAFFINIYNTEIVFVFFFPPPKSVPNKKCFQIGMPSFHSNPILFYIPGWTLLKTEIYTEAWMNLLLKQGDETPCGHLRPPSLEGTGRGCLSQASNALLPRLLRKVAVVLKTFILTHVF